MGSNFRYRSQLARNRCICLNFQFPSGPFPSRVRIEYRSSNVQANSLGKLAVFSERKPLVCPHAVNDGLKLVHSPHSVFERRAATKSQKRSFYGNNLAKQTNYSYTQMCDYSPGYRGSSETYAARDATRSNWLSTPPATVAHG